MRNSLTIIFILLPALSLCVAWLLGRATLTRAFVAFFIWVIMCEAIMIASIMDFPPRPELFFLGVMMILLSVPGAVLVGLTGRPEKAPVAVAAQAYSSLTPDQQALLHRSARLAGKFASKHVGNYLRDKGYARTAEAMQQAGRLI